MLDFTEEKNSKQELERNEVVTELDADAQLKLEVIQTLLEPCDRATYGKRLKEVKEFPPNKYS
jgi:putative transposase